MKRTNFNEIKSLTVDQLSKRLAALKVELADLVLERNMKKLTDSKAVFKKRKDIAQVLTVTRQKQLLAQIESMDKKEEAKKGAKTK